jgi:hypothetical protein
VWLTERRLDGSSLLHSDDEDAAGRSVATIDGAAQHEGHRGQVPSMRTTGTGMHSWPATDGGYGTVRASRRQDIRLLESMVRVRHLISWKVEGRLLVFNGSREASIRRLRHHHHPAQFEAWPGLS